MTVSTVKRCFIIKHKRHSKLYKCHNVFVQPIKNVTIASLDFIFNLGYLTKPAGTGLQQGKLVADT
jgi:hypothetical protein